MERDYHAEHYGHVPASAFPYTTTNLDPSGAPIEVKSAAHLSQLCKQFGVRHRDDTSWEDTRSMFNPKTGKVEYREGSGRGLPGQWI